MENRMMENEKHRTNVDRTTNLRMIYHFPLLMQNSSR